MKALIQTLSAAVLLGLAAAPAAAFDRVVTHTRTTTVTRHDGPMMHRVGHRHHRKVCKTRWVHHRRVTKCWYR